MARKQSAGYTTVMIMLHLLTIVLVVVVIAWLGTLAYHFSYKVFADEAYSETGGGTVTSTVRVEGDTSNKELAEMLENAGLIEDKWVFYFQLRFSGKDDEVNPGSYRLTSTMTAEEMIANMTVASEEEEEEDAGAAGSVTAGSAGLLDSSLSEEAQGASDDETRENADEGSGE